MATLKHPFVTEKAMVLLENENKLQFLVDNKATKKTIKRDLEKAFDQKVKRVYTLMTMHGEKKAIVSFENEKAAEEILSRLGIM
ncbi:MAG: 50S ribosomal protein L23 [Methanoregula sp.]|jgi:large subunit ribosomal protein L23